jgi:nicotinate-nucleotide--dimethylbenzimidazole phosphoribosyltransferase
MTAEQARGAITIGIEAAHEAASDGSTLIGIGEMGIANSTSAAAILSAVARVEPITMAGRGTGIDDAGLRHKAGVISEALAMHRDSLDDGLSMLAAVGGFEIGAMAGACIGGASRQVPVVVDGFIATAAAAIAEKLCPGICKRHLFFSHVSAEGGHALAVESLGAQPLLSLQMRLGEGTGAAIAMNLIEASLALFHEMATFASAGVSGKIA